MTFQKVCVFGNTASGKSVLARKIAQKLNLPLIELDKMFYHADWTHVPYEEFWNKQKTIFEQEKWVIDGTFAESGLYERFAMADKVILLDSKPISCLKRALSRRGKDSQRLPNGADDRKMSWGKKLKFAYEILSFNRTDKRQILRLAHQFPEKFILIDDWTDEEELLKQLE